MSNVIKQGFFRFRKARRFVGGGENIHSFVDDYHCFGIAKPASIVMVNGTEKNRHIHFKDIHFILVKYQKL